jgi:PQQ-like domain
LASLIVATISTMAVPAVARIPQIAEPRWSRPLADTPQSGAFVSVLQPLSETMVLVRNGDGVFAADAASGKTVWWMPNVEDAIIDGGEVVFRRRGMIFAARARDAGVLWKRPCGNAPYVVAAGDRLVTVCGGLSTILRAHDGSVLARHAINVRISPVDLRGARALNADYVMAMSIIDGAWLGELYSIVDAHTGAFLWSQSDFSVIDVTPTTISISPYPSMLPWATTGTLVRRRLADGTTLATESYTPPSGSDGNGRGFLVRTRAATYVSTNVGKLFRFRPGSPNPDGLLSVPSGSMITVVPLGETAFIFDDKGPNHEGAVYVDRPTSAGGFAMRALGRHAGPLSLRSPQESYRDVTTGDAVVFGDRIAFIENQLVRVYDESGTLEMTAASPCTLPQLAATRSTIFIRCAYAGLHALAAYARPGSSATL